MREGRLSIDPGANGGWALWDETRWADLVPPVDTGLVSGEGDNWLDRAHSVGILIGTILDELATAHWHITTAYIEQPQLFETGAGMVSARSGSLFKLSYVTGCIGMVLHAHGCKIVLTSVNWKGQLPKHVVTQRIQQKLPASEQLWYAKLHIWDAIGIGLYEKGYF